MDVSTLAPLVVAVLGVGGFVGGIVALIKLRPETGQIVVNAAQDALIVQSGVLQALHDENTRLNARVIALEAEIRALKAQVLANYAEDHPDRWRRTGEPNS
jgi:threonine dehydratase